MTAVLTTRPAPPSTLRIALARVRLELRLFARDPGQVAFSFAYPVIMLVIFGSVFGDDEVVPGVGFRQYFLAGIAATGVMLTSGARVENLSGGTWDEQFFGIVVPAGADSLTVTTSGGSGSLLLFARRGTVPNFGDYDCQSFNPGNDERCVFALPTAPD